MDRKATFIAWRYFVYALISVAGILVPALGILKIDAAYGNHYWLFEPVEWTVVGKMFTYYLIVFKVLILLTTGYVGRLFCGWFCPGGMLGMFNLRITEKFTIRKGKRRIRKWSYYLVHAGVALAFTLITMNWFIDLRVLLDNGAGAFAGSWIATGTVLVLSFLYSAFVGYNFCKTWCPSGWYFKLISQKNPIGIKFENHDGRCITCRSCVRSCPIGLDPISSSFRSNECHVCAECVDSCITIARRKNFKQILNVSHSSRKICPIILDVDELKANQ